MILLVIFVASFAYLVGFICCLYDPLLVLLALLVTFAGFMAMTVFAYTTNFDLTKYWAVLFGASIVLLVMGLICLFVECSPLFIVLCVLGVTLGLVYVAYDTQLIIGQSKYS
eukprot:CAMPEP_0168610732 /NCGR_PEP_ID=MMETSP0449_2-20121227/1951_1 /TAXON_ID=1082188 /ORGANISM="Strombidium rassoulzadegani, Strain ras09" /LENGTH=111 /DNA_ID=CAMNT_0008651071 /DNA_START=323 /DNA_END=654 /DNA_ORIENTATION=+